MKKLALLLAALGIMSASAYAQNSELRITHVGQEIEIENDSGGANIGESVYFDTNVGLAYKDWTFGVIGAKRWAVDTEDTDSLTGRIVLDAWKHYDNYKVGFRFRSENAYDRYYARLNYSKGMFWSNWDVWYESRTKELTDGNDAWRGEVYPLGIQYKGVRVGWFIDAEIMTGSVKKGEREQNFEHQIRAYAPLYKGEKLTLTTQIRYTLTVDDKFNDEKASEKSRYEDFGRTRIYLESDYKVNDSLNVYLKYGYEFRDKEYVSNGKSDENKNYYGDLIAGWKYKF